MGSDIVWRAAPVAFNLVHPRGEHVGVLHRPASGPPHRQRGPASELSACPGRAASRNPHRRSRRNAELGGLSNRGGTSLSLRRAWQCGRHALRRPASGCPGSKRATLAASRRIALWTARPAARRIISAANPGKKYPAPRRPLWAIRAPKRHFSPTFYGGKSCPP